MSVNAIYRQKTPSVSRNGSEIQNFDTASLTEAEGPKIFSALVFGEGVVRFPGWISYLRASCGFAFLPLPLITYSPSSSWKAIPTAFRPVNVTAMGGIIWVCGADEMILSSRDGGATWETKPQNRDGEVWLNVSFVDEKVGEAAGTGGVLLSTIDSGQTWNSLHLYDSVRSFSFADTANGIAPASDSAQQFVGGFACGSDFGRRVREDHT